MNWLAENALPIWIGGAIALTMALIVYFQLGTRGSQLGVAAVLLITAIASASKPADRNTARSRRTHALRPCSNDRSQRCAGRAELPGVRSKQDLRNDVDTLMPLVSIERARIIEGPKTEVGPNGDWATTEFRGFILAVHKKDGMKGGGEDRFTLNWIRSGDRWLLENYTSQKNLHRAAGRNRS